MFSKLLTWVLIWVWNTLFWNGFGVHDFPASGTMTMVLSICFMSMGDFDTWTWVIFIHGWMLYFCFWSIPMLHVLFYVEKGFGCQIYYQGWLVVDHEYEYENVTRNAWPGVIIENVIRKLITLHGHQSIDSKLGSRMSKTGSLVLGDGPLI